MSDEVKLYTLKFSTPVGVFKKSGLSLEDADIVVSNFREVAKGGSGSVHIGVASDKENGGRIYIPSDIMKNSVLEVIKE